MDIKSDNCKGWNWWLTAMPYIVTILTAICLAPPIYGLYLIRFSRFVPGYLIIALWLFPFLAFLKFLDRRGIARIGISFISSIIALSAFGYLFWYGK